MNIGLAIVETKFGVIAADIYYLKIVGNTAFAPVLSDIDKLVAEMVRVLIYSVEDECTQNTK